MEKLYSTIREEAKEFLPVEKINDFINLISLWNTKIKEYFFQITGQGDTTKLELGCQTENVLVDITFSKNESKVNILVLKYIDWIQYTESNEATELSIHCSGRQAFYYRASTNENRENLKTYANHLLSLQEELENKK